MNQNTCLKELAPAIANDTLDKTYFTKIEELKRRYTNPQQFGAGKGGAYVASVLDQNKSKRVIKIFPSVTEGSNKYNYRELFYTCLNSFITYKQLGFEFAGSDKQSAFPKIWELGVTDAPNPGENPHPKQRYPYMVFEFVDGVSFTDLAKNPGNSQAGYTVYAKEQIAATDKNKTFINRQKTEAVLYQIALMLDVLSRMQIDGQAYGFSHADLNPGNIMVRKDKSIKGKGKLRDLEVVDVPLVTFIDFGHSTSNLDGRMGKTPSNTLKTKWQEKWKIRSGSMEDFYFNLNRKKLAGSTLVSTALKREDADMGWFMLETQALLESGNFEHAPFMNALASCGRRDECVAAGARLASVVLGLSGTVQPASPQLQKKSSGTPSPKPSPNAPRAGAAREKSPNPVKKGIPPPKPK